MCTDKHIHYIIIHKDRQTIRKTHRWARTWVFQNVVVVEVASVGEGLAATIIPSTGHGIFALGGRN